MGTPNFIVVSPNNAAKERIFKEIEHKANSAHVMRCHSLDGLWRYITIHSSCVEETLTIYIDAVTYKCINECVDHLVLLWVIGSKLKKDFLIYVFSDDEELLYATGLPETHRVLISQT